MVSGRIVNELEISRLFDIIKVFLWLWSWICNSDGSNLINRSHSDNCMEFGCVPLSLRHGHGIPTIIQNVPRSVKQEGMK